MFIGGFFRVTIYNMGSHLWNIMMMTVRIFYIFFINYDISFFLSRKLNTNRGHV